MISIRQTGVNGESFIKEAIIASITTMLSDPVLITRRRTPVYYDGLVIERHSSEVIKDAPMLEPESRDHELAESFTQATALLASSRRC